MICRLTRQTSASGRSLDAFAASSQDRQTSVNTTWCFEQESLSNGDCRPRPLFSCALITVLSLFPFGFVMHAAELDGVQVPNTLQVDGKTLHLNGFGLRTYSILRIHIYVASLYLEHLNTDPEQVSVIGDQAADGSVRTRSKRR